jgi:muramoyltetrapeptide carboxypeptidase LdcA involved in peptidoglycan recycling
MNLIKPNKLNKGDTIATVSLSWGGAGDEEILWRYNQGKERLETLFGLEVVEMPHTLSGTEYVYNHPKERAEDFMQAFADPEIKAVIACIGGEDSIRMLPFIDFDVIKNNPKIFSGYSDSTVPHFMCMKAGVSSFYGPAILTDFAENVSMSNYTVNAINKAWFNTEPIGENMPSDTYTAQRLKWIVENRNTARQFYRNTGYELLQGAGKVEGKLIGGCLEVIAYIMGTTLFPPIEYFDNAILFLETSEELPPVWLVEDNFRHYGTMGILGRVAGLFWGKPQGGIYYEEYKAVIKKVLAEFGREDMPVLYNGSFGHNEPKTILPYGAMAEINCESKSFAILESGVV